MAIRRTRVDTTLSAIITESGSFPPEATTPDKDETRLGVYPLRIYEGYNYLPTSYGYKSFFGLDSTLDATGLPVDVVVEDIFIYQTRTYTNLLVALTGHGVFVRQGADWVHLYAMPEPPEGSSLLWTKATINNILFMYRSHYAQVLCFEDLIDGTGVLLDVFNGMQVQPTRVDSSTDLSVQLFAFTPTLLNMEGQVGLYRAKGSLGFWDTDDSIAWSAINDYTDFAPSLTTLANLTKVSAQIGRITVIKSHGDGFLVYATRSIVYLYEALDSMLRYKSATVLGNVGVAYPREVVSIEPDTTHFAFTSMGVVQIADGSAQPIVPETSDYLKRTRTPQYLDVLNNRYLCFSIMDPNFIEGNVEFSAFTIDPDNWKYAGSEVGGGTVDGITVDGGEVCFTVEEGTEPQMLIKPHTFLPILRHWGWQGLNLNWETRPFGSDTLTTMTYQPREYLVNSLGFTYYPVSTDTDAASLEAFYTDQLDAFEQAQQQLYTPQYAWDTNKQQALASSLATLNVVHSEDAIQFVPSESLLKLGKHTYVARSLVADIPEPTLSQVYNTALRVEMQTPLGLRELFTVPSNSAEHSNFLAFIGEDWRGSTPDPWPSGVLNPEPFEPFGTLLKDTPVVAEEPAYYIPLPADYSDAPLVMEPNLVAAKLRKPVQAVALTPVTTKYYGSRRGVFPTQGPNEFSNTVLPSWLIHKGTKYNIVGYIKPALYSEGAASPLGRWGRQDIYHSVSGTVSTIAGEAVLSDIGAGEPASATFTVDMPLIINPIPANITDALTSTWYTQFYSAARSAYGIAGLMSEVEALAMERARISAEAFVASNPNYSLVGSPYILYGPNHTIDSISMEIVNSVNYESTVYMTEHALVELELVYYQMSIVDLSDEFYGPALEIPTDTSIPMYNTRRPELKGLMAVHEWFWNNNNHRYDLDASILIAAATRQVVPLGMPFAEATSIYGIQAQAAFSNRFFINPINSELLPTGVTQRLICGVVPPIGIPPIEIDPVVYEPWEIENPPFTWVLSNGSPAPVNPTLYGAYVYDIHLGKWGVFKGDYKQLVDYQPVNNYTPGSISYKNFMVDGGCLTPELEVCLFTNTPQDSYIRYGKYQHLDYEFSAIENIEVTFNSNSTGSLVLNSSLDGRQLEYGLAQARSFNEALSASLQCNKVGKWATITITGQYDLASIRIESYGTGRR